MSELINLIREQESLKTESRILRVRIIRCLAAEGKLKGRRIQELLAKMESKIMSMQLNKASFDDLLDVIEAYFD